MNNLSVLFFLLSLLLSTSILNGQESNPKAEEEVFMVVENMPRFPGCEDVIDKDERKECSQKKLLNFIYSNIKYPTETKENGLEGTVISQFIVDKTGTISDIVILRSIDNASGEEVNRVINLMNEMPQKWIPGTQRGHTLKVKYTLPIKFKLENDAEEVTKEDVEIKKGMADKKPVAGKMVEEKDVKSQSPLFPGCSNKEPFIKQKQCADLKLLQYLYSNLQYPAEARTKGIQGTTIISFLVKKDGSLTNFKIKKDIGGGCGEAALKTVKSMGTLDKKWVPGTENGVPVDMTYTLPVKFKLE